MLPPATVTWPKHVAIRKRKSAMRSFGMPYLHCNYSYQSQGWMKRSAIRGMRFPNSWFGLCGLLARKTMEPYCNKWRCPFQPFPFKTVQLTVTKLFVPFGSPLMSLRFTDLLWISDYWSILESYGFQRLPALAFRPGSTSSRALSSGSAWKESFAKPLLAPTLTGFSDLLRFKESNIVQ